MARDPGASGAREAYLEVGLGACSGFRRSRKPRKKHGGGGGEERRAAGAPGYHTCDCWARQCGPRWPFEVRRRSAMGAKRRRGAHGARLWTQSVGLDFVGPGHGREMQAWGSGSPAVSGHVCAQALAERRP